jgi:hypothetical protein
MTIQSSLMIALALASASCGAAAAASAPGGTTPAGHPVTAIAPDDSTRAQPREPESDTDDGGFFTPTRTCLLLGTLGAFVLVARRSGGD